MFPFLTDQTSGLGVLAAYGLIIARPQYRAQFQLQNYSVPMNDVMVPYNPLGKFSHLTPEVGGAGLGHIQAQTKWQAVLGLQPSNHCKVVPSSKKLHPDSHGDYCRI